MLNKYLYFLVALFVIGCAGSPVSSSAPAIERDIGVTLKVPDTAWRIDIKEVYQIDDALIVISELSRPAGHGGQMITTVVDTVRIAAPDLPVKHYVVGKTWNWENSEPYKFVPSRNALDADLLRGKRLYP